MRPNLGIPDDISVLDIFLFGLPAKSLYNRWEIQAEEITSRGQFAKEQFLSLDQIKEWIKTRRHKVMYRDQSRID